MKLKTTLVIFALLIQSVIYCSVESPTSQEEVTEEIQQLQAVQFMTIHNACRRGYKLVSGKCRMVFQTTESTTQST